MKADSTGQCNDVEASSTSQIISYKYLKSQVNNFLLYENSVYASKKVSTKAFFIDDRHVGTHECVKFSCRSKSCPARLRFQRCSSG
ncbi:hypothetical protein HI914_05614 [Erysiphe necator]|nr:hypothetical protein HI914_05614 [Erysiphe necator]